MKHLLILALLASTSSAKAATASASIGQQVSINVTAAGTAPFTYAWLKDGVPIPGSYSNPLSIPAVQASDAGVYTVKVSNAAGSTTSDTASLDVLSVTASGGAATGPDLSKQRFRGDLNGAVWTPPVAQFPSFAIAPIKTRSDPGSHFNNATDTYTVGPGEGGTYKIDLVIRTQDQPPPNCSIGITAGTDNTDTNTLWAMTPGPTSNYVRFGASNPITIDLNAGDQIRANIFVQFPIQIIGYSLGIERK